MRAAALLVVAALAGGGGDAGSQGCGPNTCGSCRLGCTSSDVCRNGSWSCGCICDDGAALDDLAGEDLAGADLSSPPPDFAGADLAGLDLAMCTGGIQPPQSYGDAGAIRYDCTTDSECGWVAEGCFDFCVRAGQPSHYDPCEAACNPTLPPCACILGACTACYASGPFCGM